MHYDSCSIIDGKQLLAAVNLFLSRKRGCVSVLPDPVIYKNSSGDEIANVNFFYNIAHVEASAYAH